MTEAQAHNLEAALGQRGQTSTLVQNLEINLEGLSRASVGQLNVDYVVDIYLGF